MHQEGVIGILPKQAFLATLGPLRHYYPIINTELLIVKSLLVSQPKFKCQKMALLFNKSQLTTIYSV